jgi:uncharacterized protein (DUF433 family)
MIKEKPTWRDHIIQDPTIMVGKPVVKGTRIPVELVLEYLAVNPNFDELFTDYPRLTMDDVKACFAYAQDQLERTRREQMPATPEPDTPLHEVSP